MEIKGKVHLFFEQSGTFKNEFKKLGYDSYDYDIQNNFGQTDHVIDLFDEIEKAYRGGISIFDTISYDDLIMAFFPCIYFTGSTNPMYYRFDNYNYRGLTKKEIIKKMVERSRNRQYYFELLLKFVGIVIERGLRLIIENPYSTQHFLHNNFFKEPTIVDKNRRLRGDAFMKPTGYWFFNCETTHLESRTKPKIIRTIYHSKGNSKGGICSEERSMISPDYARNFICDFILGKEQKNTQLTLF